MKHLECPKCHSRAICVDENNVATCENCGYINYAEVYYDRRNIEDDFEFEDFANPDDIASGNPVMHYSADDIYMAEVYAELDAEPFDPDDNSYLSTECEGAYLMRE
jgi:transcription initiation factor TFIIIB Brf1 subunit/transcription initiation factor TFIIB